MTLSLQSPRRVRVAKIVSGRYEAGKKPLSWDDRYPGVETILTTDGETLSLNSAGGQATPAPGWELLLTKELPDIATAKTAFCWTLYGIGRVG